MKQLETTQVEGAVIQRIHFWENNALIFLDSNRFTAVSSVKLNVGTTVVRAETLDAKAVQDVWNEITNNRRRIEQLLDQKENIDEELRKLGVYS